MYHNHPTRPMQRETAAPRSARGRSLGSSKTLTFNRAYKVMPVDLARPAMACKLVNRHSGRPGRVLTGKPGLLRGDSLFGGGAPRAFCGGGLDSSGSGYTYPVGGAFGSPLRAVGALGA